MLPKVIALLTADSVTKDPRTGKFSVAGIFNVVRAKTFPHKLRFAVYLAVVEGRGNPDLSVRITDVDESGPALAEFPVEDTEFDDPIAVHDYLLPDEGVATVNFVRPGVYLLQAVCNGEVLFERRLTVSRRDT